MAVAPGSGDWTPVAEFTPEAVPDLNFAPGQPYLLELRLPFEVPAWLADPIAGVVGTVVTLDGVAIDGGTIRIWFRG